MAYLTREQILGADDIAREDVPVPEWGGVVCVQAWDAERRDRFEASVVELQGRRASVNTRNVRARAAAWSIVDPESPKEKPRFLFSPQDVDALGEKSAKALDRVFGVVQALNGLADEDVEALAKNSSSAQGDVSRSDSA